MFVISENKKWYRFISVMFLFLVIMPMFEVPVYAGIERGNTRSSNKSSSSRDTKKVKKESRRNSRRRKKKKKKRNRSNNNYNYNAAKKAAEKREAEKKGLLSKIADGIKKIGKKLVETVKNPVKSIGKAVGDIADGARKGINSAKNIVTGNISLADLGNVGMVAFGGIGGSYLIGDASGGNPVSDIKNNNVGNKTKTTRNSSVKTKKTKISNRIRGGGSLPSFAKKNTFKNTFIKNKIPSYNNTTIGISESFVIPGAYIKPKITSVKVKTGLASPKLTAEVLSKNDKVKETNNAMKEFKKEYSAFEVNMKKIEKEKEKMKKTVKKLRKYDRATADKLEKRLNQKKIVEADFNQFAKDRGLINEEIFTVNYDKKIKDPRYDSFEDYLSIVSNIKKANQAKLEEYNQKAEYNEKVILENKQNKRIQEQNQSKLNDALLSQKEAIKKIDQEIDKQKAYEREMDRAVINNSQNNYNIARKKIEESKNRILLLNNKVEFEQKEIDMIIEETKKSYK